MAVSLVPSGTTRGSPQSENARPESFSVQPLKVRTAEVGTIFSVSALATLASGSCALTWRSRHYDLCTYVRERTSSALRSVAPGGRRLQQGRDHSDEKRMVLEKPREMEDIC